jgi:tetratricopeptide (TPR) repeat protein
MRATVFTDPALTKQAGRFVWLSIDTENAANAAYLDRYPWKAVPTFQVLDPKTKRIAYQWIGAVDEAELVRRLGEAESAFRSNGKSAAAPSGPDTEVLDLAMAGNDEACTKRSLELAPGLDAGGIKANVVAIGLDCALSASKDAPWRAQAVTTLEAAVREALHYEGLLDDDRSSLYGSLVDARDRQDDEAGGKAAAEAWLDWLEVQAKEAPSVEARAALDGYRVSAALRAGAPERALAAIEASERELPDDYNPPARLAIVLREMGRYDDALAASDRALAKAYGPRKLTIFDARASIYDKQGNHAAVKSTLEQALAYAKRLPKPQRSARWIARIKKRLAGA